MDAVGGTDSQIICDTNPSYEEIIEAMPFKPASRITEADEQVYMYVHIFISICRYVYKYIYIYI
jgi:hypothetical protein